MWRPYAPTGSTSDDDDDGDKCRVFACVRPSTKATEDIKPGEKDNENLVVQSLTFHVSFYFFKHHGDYRWTGY